MKKIMPTMTSGDRQDVYKRIFLLNRSFHFIVQRLDELVQTKLFNVRDLREMAGLAQELQTQINSGLLDPLHSAELDDWSRYGKVQKNMEKRLRTPLPERQRKKRKG
jgi:hypothetical protein